MFKSTISGFFSSTKKKIEHLLLSPEELKRQSIKAEIERIDRIICSEQQRKEDAQAADVQETEQLVLFLQANRKLKQEQLVRVKTNACSSPNDIQQSIYWTYQQYHLEESSNCFVHVYDYNDALMSDCNCTSTVKYNNYRIYDAGVLVQKLLRRNKVSHKYRKILEIRKTLLQHILSGSVHGVISELINAYL